MNTADYYYRRDIAKVCPDCGGRVGRFVYCLKHRQQRNTRIQSKRRARRKA